MACTFIEELSKLRKLSMESVENTASFAPFKRYLHVVRPVEEELRTLLRRVNQENKKCLVMLCGSAGDGKSHLMSYLRHADPEGLLNSFELYNDATESSAPELTSIDTLYEKLAPFNDGNYQVDDGFKMILAINLGTLNNFIESDKGQAFTKLKQYVEENEIFSSYTRKEVYISDSVFQHISFADYQVFTLKEDGVGTEFLSTLIGKVFCETEENPFYQAYKNNDSCTLCQRCPVRHNYEFLSKPEHQQAVIKKIVEVVIKDKAIVSTRDILNLLFDIIVHPDFDYSDMCKCATSEVKYLTKYIKYSTPTDTEEAKRQFDVNFFGMVRVNRAVLPIMHRQGYGRIINMSSVAAPIAIPFQAYYSASKAAVRTYTMALYSEVKPYGIEVCAIMPGDIATGFTAARKKNPAGDEAYGGRISRSVAVMEHDEQTGITAEKAGEYVAGKALQPKVPVLCTLGGKYKLFVFLTRLLPTKVLVDLVGEIYAK